MTTRQTPDAVREEVALEIARDLMVKHFGPGKSSAVPASWVIEAMLAFAALDSRAGDAGEGWKLVPVEPTQAMVDNAFNLDNTEQQRRDTWFLMLAATPAPAVDASGGWIVSDADGVRWRAWENGSPAWTEDREQATRYHRRKDAEAVHRDDDGAWRVVPFGTGAASGSIRHAMERVADLSERWTDSLVPQINEIARGALANDKPATGDDLRQRFRDASRGLGRAGTTEWPGGPYMSMADAAAVYADLIQGGTGRGVIADEAAVDAQSTSTAIAAGERESFSDGYQLGFMAAKHPFHVPDENAAWASRESMKSKGYIRQYSATPLAADPAVDAVPAGEVAKFLASAFYDDPVSDEHMAYCREVAADLAALSHGEGRK
ncbi:hypothetical protein ACQR50_10305 [Sphingomonas sp. Xoc002]|uniref:hypothetical protein n=1 Tax=Sphingomonas sp. Xoc002 TaxID=2837624 RepID=UPI003D16EF2A